MMLTRILRWLGVATTADLDHSRDQIGLREKLCRRMGDRLTGWIDDEVLRVQNQAQIERMILRTRIEALETIVAEDLHKLANPLIQVTPEGMDDLPNRIMSLAENVDLVARTIRSGDAE